MQRMPQFFVSVEGAATNAKASQSVKRPLVNLSQGIASLITG